MNMLKSSNDGVHCHIVFHSDRYTKTVSYLEHRINDPEGQHTFLKNVIMFELTLEFLTNINTFYIKDKHPNLIKI